MSIADLLASLEASRPAVSIRDSLYLFPLIESLHVFGLAMVFGTIMIIDLRLLGIASTRRPFTMMASDILKWTWLAFALTATTGALMFITNAGVYYHNALFPGEDGVARPVRHQYADIRADRAEVGSSLEHGQGGAACRENRRRPVAAVLDRHHLHGPLGRFHHDASGTAGGYRHQYRVAAAEVGGPYVSVRLQPDRGSNRLVGSWQLPGHVYCCRAAS